MHFSIPPPLMVEVRVFYYYIENNHEHMAWWIRQVLQNRQRLIEMGQTAGSMF